MEKRTLHIDGEYLRKATVEMDDLKKSLKKILGEVGYPTHVIYYGANKVSKCIVNRLGELDIPNLKVNTDGYIAILSNGKRVQKGVDSTIVVNVLRDDSEGIYLLSGDGDMFPIAKTYIEDKRKRLVTLSFKSSTAEELKKYSNHFYLDLEEEKTSVELSLEKIEKIIYRAWSKETKGDHSKYLTSSRLGQLGSEDHDKHYFFLRSGEREEQIYLNYKEISETERDLVKIGSKLSFDLASGKGKNAIAKCIEMIHNA